MGLGEIFLPDDCRHTPKPGTQQLRDHSAGRRIIVCDEAACVSRCARAVVDVAVLVGRESACRECFHFMRLGYRSARRVGLVAKKIGIVGFAGERLKSAGNTHGGVQFRAVVGRDLLHFPGLDGAFFIRGSAQGLLKGNFFGGVFGGVHFGVYFGRRLIPSGTPYSHILR